jgi:hypothetical protein
VRAGEIRAGEVRVGEVREGEVRASEVGVCQVSAWQLRLLTNNLPAAERARLTASGDETVISVLYQTRAVIGAPK